jgi:hypothetical protein
LLAITGLIWLQQLTADDGHQLVTATCSSSHSHAACEEREQYMLLLVVQVLLLLLVIVVLVMGEALECWWLSKSYYMEEAESYYTAINTAFYLRVVLTNVGQVYNICTTGGGILHGKCFYCL